MVAAPAIAPVSLFRAKPYLRVGGADEDDLIRCADCGRAAADRGGQLAGCVIDRPRSAQDLLAPLVRHVGLDAHFSDRDAHAPVSIDPGELIRDGDDRPVLIWR
ncbi:MAG: hypothetical protein NT037_07500 [Hyphomicrobiales bacterium]|nr:hypothetical protein [Hyphomicrobiales bacterium]